jgi:hypothetical protein
MEMVLAITDLVTVILTRTRHGLWIVGDLHLGIRTAVRVRVPHLGGTTVHRYPGDAHRATSAVVMAAVLVGGLALAATTRSVPAGRVRARLLARVHGRGHVHTRRIPRPPVVAVVAAGVWYVHGLVVVPAVAAVRMISGAANLGLLHDRKSSCVNVFTYALGI